MVDAIVRRLLGESVALLLEHRPESPVTFINEHLRQILHSSSPVQRAHRFVRLARPGSSGFTNNVAAAFCALDPERASAAAPIVRVADFGHLVRLLCADLPVDVGLGVLAALGPTARGQDVLTFGQFHAGIEACLMYEFFFEACELLHAELRLMAVRTRTAQRLCAIAVLHELLGTSRTRAGGLLAISWGSVSEALERARSGSSGLEAALDLLARAGKLGVEEHASKDVVAANSDDKQEVTLDVFTRAVFAAICMPGGGSAGHAVARSHMFGVWSRDSS